jgi:protein-histidine pros-kinase
VTEATTMHAPERSLLVRAVERHFPELLEAAPDAIVIVAADGQMLLVNRQAERLFGYEREELLGRDVEMLIPERFRPGHSAHRAAYAGDARPRPMDAGLDLRGLRKDGSEFPSEISLSPVVTEEGRLVIAAIRDVTARRELLAREQAARAAAEAATLARDGVLAVVSHDLQNLLAAIGYTMTVLLRTAATTEAERRMHRCGEVVEGSLASMRRLLRDILEAERMGSAPPQVTVAPQELAGLIAETVELMAPLAAEKGVRLELRCEAEPAWALCERERIQQALQNLVGNAIHFTPDRQRVMIRLWREQDEMRVAVRDEGRGIPSEQHPYVFERYWRGRGASRHGIGLGLFIVKRLIDAHGGRIWVEDAPGAGATFVFTLPATDEPG